MAKKKTARKTSKTSKSKSAKKPSPRSGGAVKGGAGAKTAAKPAARSMPSTSLRAQALSLLGFSHKMITDMMDGVPAAQATAQAAPANNHVLWTFGHLAMTNDWLAGLIDGKPSQMPTSYEPLFNMGSTPTTDPSAYPSLRDVRAAYDRAYDRLVNAAKKRNDAELLEPTAGNSHGFANNKVDCVLKAAWHEGWHIGQIADLRRGLGIKPMMGGSGS